MIASVSLSSVVRADGILLTRVNPYARPHVYLGAEGQGVLVLGATGARSFLDHGGGFGVFLGGRINRWTALELGWQATLHNPQYDVWGAPVGRVGLQALTLEGKFYPVHGWVQPYVSGGGGVY